MSSAATPDVGGHGDLRAAAERVAVQHRDHRSREARELIADGPHPFRHRRGVLFGPQRAQLLEVTARDESAIARALDDQGVSARCRVDRFFQLRHGVERDGVARVRAIDGEHRQPVGLLVELQVHHSASAP